MEELPIAALSFEYKRAPSLRQFGQALVAVPRPTFVSLRGDTTFNANAAHRIDFSGQLPVRCINQARRIPLPRS